MKECTTCHQTYADDDLNFCLSDGTSLVSRSDSPSQETVVLLSPLVQQVAYPAKPFYWLVALLALIVCSGIIFLLKSGNVNSSVSLPVIENSPLPISQSDETLDIQGMWIGTFAGRPATLVLKQGGGKDKFTGTLNRTIFEIAVEATAVSDGRLILIDEKKVLRGEGWGTLGTSRGSISTDGKNMTGSGRDEHQKPYPWSFAKK